MAKIYTIKEIAAKAKVSPGTVDRVLHNRGEVSEKTREKVLKIIKEGNYEPNIFARNLVLNKTYAVASVIPQHKRDAYWAGPYRGIQKAAHELKMLGIKNTFYFFEEEDPQAFVQAVQKALDEKPDGLLLAPVINKKVLWLSELCREKNIPLVVIDSEVPGSVPLSFIGQHAFKSGYLAGKLFDFAGKSQNIYVVTITMSTDNNAIFRQRTEGFKAYYKYLNIPVRIYEKDFHAEDKNFEIQLRELVKRVKEDDKVFVPNSKVHWVAKALKELHKMPVAKLVGYDLLKSNIQYLKDGTIDFLINQNPEKQGYRGMQIFYKYLVLKQKVADKIYMPLEIVARENLEYI